MFDMSCHPVHLLLCHSPSLIPRDVPVWCLQDIHLGPGVILLLEPAVHTLCGDVTADPASGGLGRSPEKCGFLAQDLYSIGV